MQWKKVLKNIQNNYCGDAFTSTNGDIQRAKLDEATLQFQKFYPGNYKLDWKVNPVTWTMELHPFFESEKDANWWYLKNG